MYNNTGSKGEAHHMKHIQGAEGAFHVHCNFAFTKVFAFLNLHVYIFHVDRSRSRSRSRSPSHSRRHGRGIHAESNYRSKPKAPRVEYITEFGGSDDISEPKVSGISPPSSPIRIDMPNRSGNSTFNICKYTLGELFSDGAYYLSPGILKIIMSGIGWIKTWS